VWCILATSLRFKKNGEPFFNHSSFDSEHAGLCNLLPNQHKGKSFGAGENSPARRKTKLTVGESATRFSGPKNPENYQFI
jgi:hypothetical protein